MNPTPRGLVTLALLKTRFDEGRDHLGLLEPFVVDALAQCKSPSVLAEDVRSTILSRVGLAIPLDTLRTVLGRVATHGQLKRHGGRFFLVGTLPDPGLDSVRVGIETRQRELAAALRSFAEEHEVPLTDDDALAALASFVADNKIPLVLEEPLPDSPVDRSTLSRKLTRMVARFVTERCVKSETLQASLADLVEGMVLKDTLTLGDLACVAQRFSGLQVVLDTRVLFSVLDMHGIAEGVAAKEGLALMREVGAITTVFDRTLDEMRRVLAVYEEHLATPSGRLSLYPTPLTRYVLSAKLSPSDIRTLSATLEKRLAALTISVREIPTHDRRYTLDEAALSNALADTVTGATDSPRIRHDVDCIAGVLALRRGRMSTRIEESRAVFCTMSGLVIRNAQQWYYAQGERGSPPIVHQFALSSIAWLKKPAAVRGIKMHELASVCAAALRPTRGTWNRFVENLQRLRNDGSLSDDETVAIVASELTEPLLTQIDEETDPDADTIVEAIERVHHSYKAEAESAIKEAQAQAAVAKEAADLAIARAAALDRRLGERGDRIAGAGATVLFCIAVAVVLVSAVLSIPGVFETVGGGWKFTARVVLGASLLLGAYHLVRGTSLRDLRAKARDWAAPHVRRLLYGRGEEETPPTSNTTPSAGAEVPSAEGDARRRLTS